MNEKINHPSHYSPGKFETIDVIESSGLNRSFNLGNAVKYLSRAGKKSEDTRAEDIEKAVWYLQREIKVCKENELPTDTNFDEILLSWGIDKNDIRFYALKSLLRLEADLEATRRYRIAQIVGGLTV